MMYIVQLFAVLALFVLLNLSGSHPGTFCKAASPDDNGAQQETVSQISDPMYLKFMNVEDGSFVKMEGVVGSIQASHSSYSRNTFFLKVWHALVCRSTVIYCRALFKVFFSYGVRAKEHDSRELC